VELAKRVSVYKGGSLKRQYAALTWLRSWSYSSRQHEPRSSSMPSHIPLRPPDSVRPVDLTFHRLLNSGMQARARFEERKIHL
jgi:hypothetical protein